MSGRAIPESGAIAAGDGPLYSVVGWPPEPLARWMAREQRRLDVSGFGPPHFNVRSPFVHRDEPELAARLGALLAEQPAVPLTVRGWRKLPSMVFLELECGPEVMALHERLLALAPPGPYDGERFLPHLTFALGLLPWAEEDIWAEVQALESALRRWDLGQLTLTREEGGRIHEVQAYRLE